MSNEELDCYDHWDDGVSWNEGELNRKELSIFAYFMPCMSFVCIMNILCRIYYG